MLLGILFPRSYLGRVHRFNYTTRARIPTVAAKVVKERDRIHAALPESNTTSPQAIDVGRRQSITGEPQKVEVVLKLSDALHQVIEGHVVKNWNSNGRIKTVI